ncbi:MAG: Crp/Fnr family transcriptional regulator [Thermoguttaceae bacterium]|jgi:CRP-like cAMP-binding protein
MISPECLRRYHCFVPISAETLKALAMIGEEVRVPAGTRLIGEGEPIKVFRIISEGEVDIQYLLSTGELRSVDTLGPCDIVDWPALVEPYKATAYATTTADTRLLQFDAAKLRGLCEYDPLLGYRLTSQVAKLLSDRLENARTQLVVVEP